MKIFGKHKDAILFLPMGGSGEIGINMNIYSYNNTWVAIDCGAGFSDNTLPGTSIIVPDIDALIANKIKLDAIVLTHAHEDHIGAICYLWHILRCPIYATKFTIEMVKSKLMEYSFHQDVKFVTLNALDRFKIGSFSFEMVNMTHSIPEMNAILIKANNTTIFHTGDWKFDKSPVVGKTSSEQKLKDIGKNGVSVVVSDSTNIFVEGWSKSESIIYESLLNCMKDAKQLTVVSLFASNVARVQTIANVAKKLKKQIFIAGMSINRLVYIAKQTGYLLDYEFLDVKLMHKYDRNKSILICTGCQGEVNAALAKLSNNAYPHCKIHSGDLVILSSKMIPGNEGKINAVLNQYAKIGVEVMTEHKHQIHVSGHPCRDEIAHLYKLLKPNYVIPVHGQVSHLVEHANFAKKYNINAQIVSNGHATLITPNYIKYIGTIETGYMAVDGFMLRKPNCDVMKERRYLMTSGIVVCNIIMHNDKLIGKVIIKCIGCLGNEYQYILNNMEDKIINLINQAKKTSYSEVEHAARKAISSIMMKETGVDPLIEIIKVQSYI